MPKGFTEREKDIIRAKLLESGAAFLGSYGVRKTSVEDLTRAAGISKGAFYLFFDTKEELFFELMERFETDFKQGLLRRATELDGPPRERVRALLREALVLWKTNPLFARFDRDEFEYLSRKLPEAKLADHAARDDESARALLAAWAQSGIVLACDPKLFSNLLRALFMLTLHEDEFAPAMYAAVLDVLTGQLAAYLVPA